MRRKRGRPRKQTAATTSPSPSSSKSNSVASSSVNNDPLNSWLLSSRRLRITRNTAARASIPDSPPSQPKPKRRRRAEINELANDLTLAPTPTPTATNDRLPGVRERDNVPTVPLRRSKRCKMNDTKVTPSTPLLIFTKPKSRKRARQVEKVSANDENYGVDGIKKDTPEGHGDENENDGTLASRTNSESPDVNGNNSSIENTCANEICNLSADKNAVENDKMFHTEEDDGESEIKNSLVRTNSPTESAADTKGSTENAQELQEPSEISDVRETENGTTKGDTEENQELHNDIEPRIMNCLETPGISTKMTSQKTSTEMEQPYDSHSITHEISNTKIESSEVDRKQSGMKEVTNDESRSMTSSTKRDGEKMSKNNERVYGFENSVVNEGSGFSNKEMLETNGDNSELTFNQFSTPTHGIFGQSSLPLTELIPIYENAIDPGEFAVERGLPSSNSSAVLGNRESFTALDQELDQWLESGAFSPMPASSAEIGEMETLSLRAPVPERVSFGWFVEHDHETDQRLNEKLNSWISDLPWVKSIGNHVRRISEHHHHDHIDTDLIELEDGRERPRKRAKSSVQ